MKFLNISLKTSDWSGFTVSIQYKTIFQELHLDLSYCRCDLPVVMSVKGPCKQILKSFMSNWKEKEDKILMSNNANSQAKEDIYLVNLTFGQCSITLYVGSCNNTAECVSELFCLKGNNDRAKTFR